MSDPAADGPWLSVLVPVYNVEPYLTTCIDSVMAGVQALPPAARAGVEVLLWDDASTDGSAGVMADLSRRWTPTLKTHRSAANRGVAATRNALLDAARGRHLWFVDGDDWIEPSALARLHERLTGPDAPDLLAFDYCIERGPMPPFKRWRQRLRGEGHRRTLQAPSRQRLPGGPALLAAALASGDLFMWSQVSRRALWGDDLRFPEGRTFEDMATLPRLLLRVRSAWHEPEPWVHYRRRDDSVTGVMSAVKVADLSRSLVGVRALMPPPGPPAADAARFALAHQAARNLWAAQRHARRLAPPEAQRLHAQAQLDFRAALCDDLPLLWRGYLKRGWLWRAWRLRQALR